jgi:hypothetical protein
MGESRKDGGKEEGRGKTEKNQAPKSSDPPAAHLTYPQLQTCSPPQAGRGREPFATLVLSPKLSTKAPPPSNPTTPAMRSLVQPRGCVLAFAILCRHRQPPSLSTCPLALYEECLNSLSSLPSCLEKYQFSTFRTFLPSAFQLLFFDCPLYIPTDPVLHPKSHTITFRRKIFSDKFFARCAE